MVMMYHHHVYDMFMIYTMVYDHDPFISLSFDGRKNKPCKKTRKLGRVNFFSESLESQFCCVVSVHIWLKKSDASRSAWSADRFRIQ